MKTKKIILPGPCIAGCVLVASLVLIASGGSAADYTGSTTGFTQTSTGYVSLNGRDPFSPPTFQGVIANGIVIWVNESGTTQQTTPFTLGNNGSAFVIGPLADTPSSTVKQTTPHVTVTPDAAHPFIIVHTNQGTANITAGGVTVTGDTELQPNPTPVQLYCCASRTRTGPVGFTDTAEEFFQECIKAPSLFGCQREGAE